MNESLLSVDVEAAIRKLTESQLSATSMRPIELARALFGAGARSLRIVRDRRQVWVHAPGARVPASLLERLVRTASPERDPEERYRALLELEDRGGLIWLALATAGGLELHSRDEGGEWRVRVAPRGRELSRVGSGGPAECRVSLKRRGRTQIELELLSQHLRFARRPVEVDGERVDRPAPRTSGALEGQVRGQAFEGWVRLRIDADYSCIRWIDREVLEGERYSQLAGGVAHEAVIHSRDPSNRSAAVLEVRNFREATVAGLSRVFDALEEGERERVRRVLFARAIEQRDLAVLGEAPLFLTVGGQSLSVGQLRSGAERAPLEVTGLEPRPGASDAALRLDALGRRLVTELLELPIVGSSPLSEGSALERMQRALRGGWGGARERIVSQWSRWVRGRRVPDAELTAAEQAFRTRLEELLRSGDYRVPQLEPRVSRRVRVEFVPRGSPPLRPVGGESPRLQLPRAHRILRRVVIAHERDPGTIYPALDLLFAGRDGWGSRRSQWRQHWMESL